MLNYLYIKSLSLGMYATIVILFGRKIFYDRSDPIIFTSSPSHFLVCVHIHVLHQILCAAEPILFFYYYY